MSDIHNLVTLLEQKIVLIQDKIELLAQDKRVLNEQLNQLKAEQVQLQEETNKWRKKYESLKIANTILGSDKNKTETKFKINALIREIDACIIQLSD
ncbi:hypothetical protein [Capnocytophaga catalasegens]|uniref:Cell division protein ZapB n=2 Tax=Capnocytophaga catalasegens TaxID=1004260 RepID=A0AAV5ATW9_9FLAO|nr:hypothetical protein [Capnocytophaga catalasegens]GIZ14631.1 hypothetical protein RCZ03_06320 [Capnocytophaga catalasegens]GJM50833.1 hypothetical protein RCZ15_18060 [Capnocytophaga catalasegens]GJM51986.1 hypothetical protein RCZ16_03040 [Capnocytophaga catalasegens]